jgi:hypothetical protein
MMEDATLVVLLADNGGSDTDTGTNAAFATGI